MTTQVSQCFSCSHYRGFEKDAKGVRHYQCTAFEEIPDKILFNKVMHTKHYPGDHGILYNPI